MLLFHKLFQSNFSRHPAFPFPVIACKYLKDLSNCCKHEYDQLISRINFWRDFSIWPTCTAPQVPAAAAAFLQVTRCFFSFCLWVERIGTIRNAKYSENVISRQLKTMSVEFNHTAFIGQRDFDQEVSENDFEVSSKVCFIYLLQFYQSLKSMTYWYIVHSLLDSIFIQWNDYIE